MQVTELLLCFLLEFKVLCYALDIAIRVNVLWIEKVLLAQFESLVVVHFVSFGWGVRHGPFALSYLLPLNLLSFGQLKSLEINGCLIVCFL